ncbi:endonuclease VII domain-containing protein [Rhodococcus qingshengii]|uniref:endonuclease VII domain-containing protein n=1 Tax=Rhodococcus qingshengii TaxID=334542 RepID=UPI003BAC1F1E
MSHRRCANCFISWRRQPGDGLNICPSCEEFTNWCSGCKVPQSKSNFSRNPSNRTGLHKYCRSCSPGVKLRSRYGIDGADYGDLFSAQGGRCAICKRTPPEDQPLVVDHSHVTSEIRGLLCSPCNTALGLLMDSPSVIDSAAAYLRSKSTA